MKFNNCFLFILFCGALSTFYSCNSGDEAKAIDVRSLPAVNENGSVNAVIEIPAGTNDIYKFQNATGSFELQKNGDQPAKVNYLPYPGNYGFIAGVSSMENPQEVLVLASSVPVGSVMEIRPIGMLAIRDAGVERKIVVGVPFLEADRVLKAKDFVDFLINFDVAKRMIEDWFLNYKGWGKAELIGWEDEKFAMNHIIAQIKK